MSKVIFVREGGKKKKKTRSINHFFVRLLVLSRIRVRVSSHQLVSRQICLIGSKVNGVHGERTLGSEFKLVFRRQTRTILFNAIKLSTNLFPDVGARFNLCD